MEKEYFKSYVYEKIKDYLDRDKAEADNFRVFHMTITPQLAKKLNKYIRAEGLDTYSQSKNKIIGKYISYIRLIFRLRCI